MEQDYKPNIYLSHLFNIYLANDAFYKIIMFMLL